MRSRISGTTRETSGCLSIPAFDWPRSLVRRPPSSQPVPPKPGKDRKSVLEWSDTQGTDSPGADRGPVGPGSEAGGVGNDSAWGSTAKDGRGNLPRRTTGEGLRPLGE